MLWTSITWMKAVVRALFPTSSMRASPGSTPTPGSQAWKTSGMVPDMDEALLVTAEHQIWSLSQFHSECIFRIVAKHIARRLKSKLFVFSKACHRPLLLSMKGSLSVLILHCPIFESLQWNFLQNWFFLSSDLNLSRNRRQPRDEWNQLRIRRSSNWPQQSRQGPRRKLELRLLKHFPLWTERKYYCA